MEKSGNLAVDVRRCPARSHRLVRGEVADVAPVHRLDARQRAAVRARGSLIRVLGAPGSGKTTVAAHAVLDRVGSGEIRPHEALVLVPTRVAAARLRHAVTTLLDATTSTPLVSSVQAFAYGLLRRDAAERGEPAPRLLSGPEQDVVLRELLAGHDLGFGRRPAWPAALREATRTRGFRAELRDLLMRAVEHGLDAEGLASLAAREGNAVWAAAAEVLAEYDEVTALSTPGGYDPAWILTATADLLEDDRATSDRVHDEVRLVVVDDAQELTAPAARLVRLLRDAGSEVVLIGDPDAATQTFRGADPHLMMEDPATVTHVLRTSWRLPPAVAEVAGRITDRIGSAGSVAHRVGATSARDDGALDAADALNTRGRAPEGVPDPRHGPRRVPASKEPEWTSDEPTLFDFVDDVSACDSHMGPVAAPDAAVATGGPELRDAAERGVGGREDLAMGPAPHPSDPTGDGGDDARSRGRVETAVLGTGAAEARFIASRLRRAHLVGGVPYSRMAVIVRGAGRSATLRRVLTGDGIPVDVPGARVPLRDEPAVRPFLRLFDVVLALAMRDSGAPGGDHERDERGDLGSVLDAETVLDLLASPLGATDSLAVRRLLRALRRAEAGLPARGDAQCAASWDVGVDSATEHDRPTRDDGALETVAPATAVLPSHGSAGEPADLPGVAAGWGGRTVRTTDELLVAAVLGDPVLEAVPPGAPVSGLRRLRDVLAAGRAAARFGDGSWNPGVTAETVLWAMWEASGLADPWRRAALAGHHRADRDLDAVVALMDAAARYVDRLPLRGPDGFLEHVRGQDVAGDTLVARAPADQCVTLTTPAGAAGLEWDLVVIAGLQEGVWPDLRLRGSVLGSAALVDTVTGRGVSPRAARTAVRADEARLFLVAVTRTRHEVLCTAVRNDDENPSPFLDLIDTTDRGDEPRPYASAPAPMTLADVVAALRRRLAGHALTRLPRATPLTPAEAIAHPSAARQGIEAVGAADARVTTTPDLGGAGKSPDADVPPDVRAAAELLWRLAEAGVPGAHPDDWWGLRGVSDDRPRRSVDRRIPVSPSKVEAFAQCELRWLLSSAGGQAGGGSVATSLGTLVHDIAATVDNGDHAALLAELDRRWSDLDLPEGWLARRQREQAHAMIDRLHRLHTATIAAGWEVVGTEIDVSVPLGRAVVRGRVDRLERDTDGRLRVVDLKTGSASSKPRPADLPTHPQLGAYQVAVAEGAFGDLGTRSAGAALMQIGKGGNLKGDLQEQPPLEEADDPRWAHELLERTAEGMAGSAYRAKAGGWCRTCESRFSCPIQPEGETLR